MSITREAAKKHIEETCGSGWLTLVDVVFDNKSAEIEITEVFQKWGGLEIRYNGESEHFRDLVNYVNAISGHLCEQCGASAKSTIIDGWETTLCKKHFKESEGKQKYSADFTD